MLAIEDLEDRLHETVITVEVIRYLYAFEITLTIRYYDADTSGFKYR